MATIDYFAVVSDSQEERICVLPTLKECMIVIGVMLTEIETHEYAPFRVVLVDTEGAHTDVCVVTLA